MDLRGEVPVMSNRVVMGAALAAVLIGGCASSTYARLVETTPAGGQVELSGSYWDAMPYARLMMAEHCRGRFELLGDHEHASVPDQGVETVDFVCARVSSRTARLPRRTLRSETP